jgi:hypothetical protein
MVSDAPAAATVTAAAVVTRAVLCCAGLWEDASFKLQGNLFWPDFWPPGTSSEAQEVVYDMVGLDATTASVSAVCCCVQNKQCRQTLACAHP